MLGTILKRWNWLEEGLLPLAATLMHAAWVYPLFSSVNLGPYTRSRPGTRSPGQVRDQADQRQPARGKKQHSQGQQVH